MLCPQCGTETPDTEWNCVSCRINVYWASKHYDDLARLRQGQGLSPSAVGTPSFLRQAHEHAMSERADRGGRVEHRVRQIARRAMGQQADAATRLILARTGMNEHKRQVERQATLLEKTCCIGGNGGCNEIGCVLKPGSGTLEVLPSEHLAHNIDSGIAGEITRGRACSIGIMAYNEQATIADAISSVLGQRLTMGQITELIVVASGCRDRTCGIVADIARSDRRIRLIEQEAREGKASAINLFISEARSPLLVMVSADVIIKNGALDALLRHFQDPTVGMVGARPTPVNSEETFLGHAVHLQWRLHDRIARQSPKLGEMVAFRNVVPGIPLDTAVDEVSLQAAVTELGYRLVYEPEAVVYNRGPATMRDFLLQRRRIHAGHLRVREERGYKASTMDALRVTRALWGSGSFTTPRAAMWSAATVGLEATARALGYYDVLRRRSSHVWEVSPTTKRGVAEGANGHSGLNVAVFHIVNFHRWQLEVGLNASRQLTRRAAERIRQALAPAASVSIQQGGIIIALVPGDRESSERKVHEAMLKFAAPPPARNGHDANDQVTLAGGIIVFSHVGPPLARSIHVPMTGADPAASAAALEVSV